MRSRLLATAALAFVSVNATSAAAQQPPEVIRGRVTDDSSRGLVATIMVTRGPDRLTQQTTSDSAGHYSVRFEQGTGDYLVYVSITGFKATRRRVQRKAEEHEFIADFKLERDVALLAAVKVTAEKPVRASNEVRPNEPEPGSNDKWKDGINGAIAPTAAGDLNAIAGTMSNVTMTGAGPSILGSGAESNLNTLNGMALAAGSIPRAARTETRVTGATFDPTRGGFAGANIDVRLGAGDRFYQNRNAFVTLDPRQLQYADATARSLGAQSGGARGSFGADGEMIRSAATYNMAIDLARNTSDPATLLDADAAALLRAGVSPDSVNRLISVAGPLGLAGALGLPDNRQHDAFSWLGRFDDTRDTLSTRALTTYAGYTRDGALGFGPTAAPSASGERREKTFGGQVTLGTFVGEGRRILTETRLAASTVRTQVSPYRALPGANIVVRSDATGARTEVTGLTLGGGSYLATDDSRWTAEGANETAWNTGGRRNRFKSLLWARADGLRQQGVPNQLGTYAFNSIAEFAAGTPASFTRTLAQPERSGSVWNTAGALAHQWAPTKFFSVLYGARLDVDGFFSAPARNAALDQALGVRSGIAPTKLHVSPRAGFSYTYNRDKDNGSGTMGNNVGRFYRTTAGVIRGGIGDFRDLLRPGVLADASAATGLAGGTTYLSCVGSAVPVVDWASFSTDPSNIPSECTAGSGFLAERAPSVSLIDPNYDVPHSWRASLDWNTSWHSLLLHVAGLSSYDLSQPGTVDANFRGDSKFTLAGEGGRPVYVSAASIDPASGSVSAAESRMSDQYGRVSRRVSDLRGYGNQVTFGLSPDVFKFRSGASFYGSVNYTLQSTQRQFRGFDGAGFGDPRVIEWAPGQFDARHVVVVSTGFSKGLAGTWTLFARAQSGLPFTPIVQGDANGDGRSGDRAFVPTPASESDAALAAQIRSLLATGSSTAKDCVLSNAGNVAGRNSCHGPWTQSVNVQWRPPTPQQWGGRVSPTLYFQNVLAGLDQAVHGGDDLRGWGSSATPDPVLFVARGFDPASQRFRYDVNPRFADTRPGRTIVLNPFRLVLDVSLRLSTDYDLQQLRRAVEPVRGNVGWERRSPDSLAAFYLRRTSSLHKAILDQTDSLFLSNAQVAALKHADDVYSDSVRTIYTALGRFLAQGQGDAGKMEIDSVLTAQKAYWKIFWQQPEIADSIITSAQKEFFPMMKSIVSVPQRDREHSQWQFGNPVTFLDTAKRPAETPSTSKSSSP
ncbi:MAG: carboxypeptidase-like regulatory domain-containing protein [Gemmatimonadota bacterium]|nr:carboxypeptidase-like regulatory domain-containing protein [Gemmatimonadota bacterium]